MPIMKTLQLRIFSAILLASLALARFSSAAETKDDGQWKSLFNGKDLTGWTPVNDCIFTVTNDNLHLVKSMGWLRTENEYTNFVLEAEWRALEPKYNSGFFIRAGMEGKPFPTDVWQVNLKESAVGELLKGSTNRVHSVTPPVPLNQWVKFRMAVRGKKLTLDVDGKRAWEFTELDAAHGYIGLQAEGKVMEFRNVRVQELGTSSSPPSQ